MKTKMYFLKRNETSLDHSEYQPFSVLSGISERDFCWQGRFFLSVGSIASLCGVPWVMPGKTQMAVRLRPYRILPAELNGHTRKTISDYPVRALCFGDFLTSRDLDKQDLSNSGTKASRTTRRLSLPVRLGIKRKSTAFDKTKINSGRNKTANHRA